MNKKRLERLNKIIDTLENLHIELEEIQQEEQDCYDNAPENLQYSERYELMQENADSMQDAYDNIETALETLQEVSDNN